MSMADAADKTTTWQWFTQAEAAARAGCSTRTLARALATGELSASRECGRVLIERAHLDCWIQARQSERAPKPEDVLDAVLESAADLVTKGIP